MTSLSLFRCVWPVIAASFTIVSPCLANCNEDGQHWCQSSRRNNVVDVDVDLHERLDFAEEFQMDRAFSIGEFVFGSPVCYLDQIIVGVSRQRENRWINALVCASATTGEINWIHETDNPQMPRRIDPSPIGVCSSPVIVNDRLYYVASNSTIYCLELSTEVESAPEPVYAIDLVERFDVPELSGCMGHVSSPVSDGQSLFVTVHPSKQEGVDTPSLIGIDLETGETTFTFFTEQSGDYPQISSPTIFESGGLFHLVFAEQSGMVYGFELDGDVDIDASPRWQFDTTRYSTSSRLNERYASFVASPVAVGSQVFIGTAATPTRTSAPGVLWCIDSTKTGDVSPFIQAENDEDEFIENPNSASLWCVTPDQGMLSVYANATVTESHVVQASAYGIVFVISRESGEIVWQRDLASEIWGTPMIVNELAIVANEFGEVHFFESFATSSHSRVIDLIEPIYSTPNWLSGQLFIMAGGNCLPLLLSE